MTKFSGLGRGLGSLIPTKQPAGEAVPQGNIREIAVESIRANPRQPRVHFSPAELEDLIASIKEHGILQPLIVSEVARNSYELIAGERRLRSAKMLGLPTVPAVVRSVSDQEKLELALIENIQRQDLNAVEEAIAFKALIEEFGLSQEEVGQRVGKSRSAVANTIRLLDLPEEMRQALMEGKISKSHARTLLAEPEAAKREHLFHAMLGGAMTVREAEARTAKSPRLSGTKKDPNILDHERRLREILGTKVEISDKHGRGKISVHYFSKDELRDLLDRLSG